MRRYTPRPWKCSQPRPTDGSVTIYAEGVPVMQVLPPEELPRSPGDLTVLTVNIVRVHGRGQPDRAYANGRLLELAPDIYEDFIVPLANGHWVDEERAREIVKQVEKW